MNILLIATFQALKNHNSADADTFAETITRLMRAERMCWRLRTSCPTMDQMTGFDADRRRSFITILLKGLEKIFPVYLSYAST